MGNPADQTIDEQTRHILAALSAQTQAELQRVEEERKRREVQEAHLEETRRLRLIQQRHTKNLEIIVERYANLGESVVGLTKILQQYLDQQRDWAVLQEWFEDLSDHVEIINDRIRLILEIQRVILSGRGNGQKAKLEDLLKKLDRDPEIASLRRRLNILTRSLHARQEQQALMGVSTTPEILLDIERTEEEIEKIHRELKSLEAE